MKIGYLGLDTGSISTKGVIVDGDNRIIASEYLWTEGNPTAAAKRVIRSLYKTGREVEVRASRYRVGTAAYRRNGGRRCCEKRDNRPRRRHLSVYPRSGRFSR